MTRTLGSMRKLPIPTTTTPLLSRPLFVFNTYRQLFEHEPALALRTLLPIRSLAQVRQEPFSELWFTPSRPARSPVDDLLGNNGRSGSSGDHKPPDERTLKLGKSLTSSKLSHYPVPLTLYSSSDPLSTPTKYPNTASSASHPLS
jgi:hypothetical protein